MLPEVVRRLETRKALSGATVVEQLTKGIAAEGLDVGMLNFVQVLRGVAGMCALWHRDNWPRHVALVSYKRDSRHYG